MTGIDRMVLVIVKFKLNSCIISSRVKMVRGVALLRVIPMLEVTS